MRWVHQPILNSSALLHTSICSCLLCRKKEIMELCIWLNIYIGDLPHKIGCLICWNWLETEKMLLVSDNVFWKSTFLSPCYDSEFSLKTNNWLSKKSTAFFDCTVVLISLHTTCKIPLAKNKRDHENCMIFFISYCPGKAISHNRCLHILHKTK